MEESNIIIAIISLGIGGTLGYLAGRSGTSSNSNQQQVESLKAEIDQYKNTVAEHFQQTASMVNEMNDSYKGVIQHLAKGSQDLCDAGIAKDIESRMIPQISSTNEAQDAGSESAADKSTSPIEPPRDYAPKKPDELGALSENYGIQGQAAQSAEQNEASETVTPPMDAAGDIKRV